MLRPYLLVCICALAVAQGMGTAYCQSYPDKTIRVVTTGIGSSSDFAARLIAQGVSGFLGQQLIIDNRASGIIPGEIVSKAQPDGYTLLMAGGTLWIGPLLQKTPYDPVKDFAPITLTSAAPNVLVVNPSLPAKSVRELIALAKAQPGMLNYASTGAGGATQLAAELFKSMAGVNIVSIPYKSGSSLMADLLGGQVQLSFATAVAAEPHIKSERLRALGVTSPQPSALFPGIPTVAASGLPGYEYETITGLFAPAKTPEPIIGRLNHDIVRFLNTAEARTKFFSVGSDVVGSSPREFADKIRSAIASTGKVIKEAGIRVE